VDFFAHCSSLILLKKINVFLTIQFFITQNYYAGFLADFAIKIAYYILSKK